MGLSYVAISQEEVLGKCFNQNTLARQVNEIIEEI